MTRTEPKAARAVPVVRAVVATWPRRIALAVALGVVVGTTAAGGLARNVAADDGPARVAAGEPVPTGPIDLEVRSWAVTDTVEPTALEGLGADAWLVVVVSALVTDRESRTLDGSAVTLPTDLPDGLALADDARPDRADRGLLLRDASPYPVLQPGLAEDVALLWPVVLGSGGSGSAEGELEVTVPSFVYRDMTVGGGRRWAETGEHTVVEVPPGDVPPSIVEPVDLEEDW